MEPFYNSICMKTNTLNNRTAAIAQLMADEAESKSSMDKIMPNEEDKSTQGRKKEDPPFLAVHISWRDDIAAYPEQAAVAFLLALYCREKMNHGVMENAKDLLRNERKCGLLGFDAKQSQMIQNEESRFWHWEGPSLYVDFYSSYYEDKMRKISAQRRDAVRIREEKRKRRKAEQVING